MGQHLLAKGLKPKGSLWSGTALIDKKYHQLIVDAHLDFIKSGAEVIITNNFSARRSRMIQNNVEEHFNYANEKAGELALKAKEISKKNILIAALLIHAAKIDENYTNVEKEIIKKALINLFKPITPSFIIRPFVPLYVAWFFYMFRFYAMPYILGYDVMGMLSFPLESDIAKEIYRLFNR